MKWRIVHRNRSEVRVELFEDRLPRSICYILIEGSKAKGYRWYSNTEILMHGVGGFFKDVSQDAAIQTAINRWKLRVQEIVNSFYEAEVPGGAE